MAPRRPPLTNREAAEQTLAALRKSGALEAVDEAIAQAFLSLASAVDNPEAKADLWREYRAMTVALREAGAGGSDDDSASFLVSIQTPGRRAKVGHRKKP
jgi:hypothetical protein